MSDELRQYPYPYVPGTIFAVVGGTVQPVEETDPEAGTYTLPDDPEDMTVRAYARVSFSIAADDTLADELDPDPEAPAEEAEDAAGNDDDTPDEDDDSTEMTPDDD